MKKISSHVCKHQGTKVVFQSQLPGWCVDVENKSPVARGNWYIPHQWHETGMMNEIEWLEWYWYGTGLGKENMRLIGIIAEINWSTSLEHTGNI